VWESIGHWFLDTTNQHIILGIFVAFGGGLIIGKWFLVKGDNNLDSGQLKRDEAFFKGIHHVISNDHDRAIEEFAKSVQLNSDTVETYVALGNLYRSKGDIDRAIRIRQSIILRPNIDKEIRLTAMLDLGLDYRKAGFMNRALSVFQDLIREDPANVKALNEIEKIYEETKDWEKAYLTRQKIARHEKGNHRHILAHHTVELGKEFQEKGDLKRAASLFKKAISVHKGCVDAYLHLGDLYFDKKEYKKAISTWKKVAAVAPRYTFLAYRRLEDSYSRIKNLKPVENFLKKCIQMYPDVFTYLALARYLYNKGDIENALEQTDNALALDPHFWEGRKLKGEILLASGMKEDALTAYRDLIVCLDLPYLKFQCYRCGFQANVLHWQCPQCKEWDTITMVDSVAGPEGRGCNRTNQIQKTQKA